MRQSILFVCTLFVLHCLALPAQEICAHRGFWKCREAGRAQNSIASLREAQDQGFWGSEFDVHMTADSILVVNHDSDLNGIPIHTSTYKQLLQTRLRNGEPIPTLDAYLEQGALSNCMLVLELKPQDTEAATIYMASQAVEALRNRGLLDPSRVMFISFSYAACEWIGRELPAFQNQYLGGEKDPETVYASSINGIDYHYLVFYRHPDWIQRAQALGMGVNVWTVNSKRVMRVMRDLGVDVITTNEPLLLREILQ